MKEGELNKIKDKKRNETNRTTKNIHLEYKKLQEKNRRARKEHTINAKRRKDKIRQCKRRRYNKRTEQN